MRKTTILLLVGLIIPTLLSTTTISQASIPDDYEAPAEITVFMYALNENGDILGSVEDSLCEPGDLRYGCTAHCNPGELPPAVCNTGLEIPYPYSTNPVTISIENDYLLDVVGTEINPRVFEFELNAMRAQAVAARTFAYFFEYYDSLPTITNSALHQVFIPFQFDALGYDEFTPEPCNPDLANLSIFQQKICNATAERRYISYNYEIFGADLPVLTEYSSDIPWRTETGYDGDGNLIPYLLGVDDPVSSYPEIIQNGHGRGLSQHGASRWAYGNLGAQGNLDAWSVRWRSRDMILAHYYTGIQVRLASDTQVRTPDYRWNPLSIDWTGAGLNDFVVMNPGQTYNLAIQVQNTGVVDWDCFGGQLAYDLRYRWRKGGGTMLGSTYVSLCGIVQGDPSAVVVLPVAAPLALGGYTLELDVLRSDKKGVETFWFSDFDVNGNRWLDYEVLVCVGGCQNSVYLPFFGVDSPTVARSEGD